MYVIYVPVAQYRDVTSSVNDVSLGGLNVVYHYRAVFLVLDEGWNVTGTRSGHAVAASSAAAAATLA